MEVKNRGLAVAEADQGVYLQAVTGAREGAEGRGFMDMCNGACGDLEANNDHDGEEESESTTKFLQCVYDELLRWYSPQQSKSEFISALIASGDPSNTCFGVLTYFREITLASTDGNIVDYSQLSLLDVVMNGGEAEEGGSSTTPKTTSSTNSTTAPTTTTAATTGSAIIVTTPSATTAPAASTPTAAPATAAVAKTTYTLDDCVDDLDGVMAANYGDAGCDILPAAELYGYCPQDLGQIVLDFEPGVGTLGNTICPVRCEGQCGGQTYKCGCEEWVKRRNKGESMQAFGWEPGGGERRKRKLLLHFHKNNRRGQAAGSPEPHKGKIP